MSHQKREGQYLTEQWAAEALVEPLGLIPGRGFMVDPTCGDGAFLTAAPEGVDVLGIEKDPLMACRACRLGVPVVRSDIRDFVMRLPVQAVVGNPPFEATLVDFIVEQARVWLPDGGVCALILPAYMLRAERRYKAWRQHWGLQQELLPRSLYPELIKPACWCVLTKGRGGVTVGFRLFEEAEAAQGVKDPQRVLRRRRRGVWNQLVVEALESLGGEADLPELYEVLLKHPNRRLGNQNPEEKIRQTLQRSRQCEVVKRGRWRKINDHCHS